MITLSVMYTKLFGSIVHSTIWREPDHVRLVWVTMLALSDKKGCVWASVPGLADAARVSVDQCRDAIDRLGSPDPDSRTQVMEGRRIEPIDGGWWLVNHAKFQAIKNMDERREQIRVAVQRHRAKKDDGEIKVINRNPRKSRKRSVSPSDQTTPAKTKKPLSASPVGTAKATTPMLLLAAIRDLAQERPVPGQPASRFIPKEKVAEMGQNVLRAYEAIGGTDAVLGATGKDWSFLAMSFGKNLDALEEA